MNQLFIATLFIGLAQTSLAGVYELEFRRVSPNYGLCQQFTAETTSELIRQSGVSIIDSGCQNDQFSTGWDSIITYQASERLAVISTSTFSVYSAAFYSNHAECEARLDLQRQLFTNATGLQPLTAYCMRSLTNIPRWETRVDGLGQSEMTPDVVAASFSGILADAETVLTNYEDALAGYGASIFEAGIYRDGFGKKLVLRLYAPEPYILKDYDDMKYENLAACSTAALAVHDILKSADRPVVAFCEEKTAGGSATLHTTALEAILHPSSIFEAKQLTTRYITLNSCQQASANIESDAGDIFGAVCAGSAENFHIHLFSRP